MKVFRTVFVFFSLMKNICSCEININFIFRQVMTSFIENDEFCQSIVRLLDNKSKKKSQKRTKLSQERDNRDMKKQEEIEKKFNLDNEELEDIFDMIAREHPDL